MGWREGVANFLGTLGNTVQVRSLLTQKAKISEQQKQDALMKDLLEYNIWTNPDDPARRLWQAKHPGVRLPTLSPKTTPEQFMSLRRWNMGGGGGGFNFFGDGGGGVPEAPPGWN